MIADYLRLINMGLVRYLFLRFYALNLEGRRRNAPAQACSDAIFLTLTMLSVPIGVMVAMTVPKLMTKLSDQREHDIEVTVVVALVLCMGAVIKPLKRYALYPEAAARFRSKSGIRTTTALYFGIPALSIALPVLASKWL